MRTFNQIALATMLMLSAVAGLRAEEVESGVKFTHTSEVRSAFIVGSGAKLSDAVVMQDFFWSWGNGVTFDVTLFASLDDPGFDSPDSGNEVDFVVGLPLGKAGNLSLGTFVLAPIDKMEAEYVTATWARPCGPVTVSVQTLLGYGENPYPDKLFLKVDYAPPHVEFSDRVSLALPLRATWDTGIDGEDAVLLRFRPELNIRTGKSTSVYVGWEGHHPFTDRENRSFTDAARAGLRVKF